MVLLIVFLGSLTRLIAWALSDQGLDKRDLIRRDPIALVQDFVGPEAIHREQWHESVGITRDVLRDLA